MGAEIIAGDCLDVLRGMADASVDAIVTSPPYAMQRAKQYGGIPEADYPEWTVAWMREARRVVKPRGSVLINIREHIRNGEMSDYVHRTRMALRAYGWIECDELIWDKKSGPPVGHPKRPRRSWERILWFCATRDAWCNPKANGHAQKNARGGIFYGATQSGAISAGGALSRGDSIGVTRCSDIARVSSGEMRLVATDHTASFPMALAAWMIRLVTPPGGTVLDPFAGSGSTLVAAAAEGFSAIGIEREPAYVEIARARVAKALADRDGALFAGRAAE